MDIYLGKSVDTFNTLSEFPLDSCLAFFDNWLKPISSVLGYAGIYTTNYPTGKGSFFTATQIAEEIENAWIQ